MNNNQLVISIETTSLQQLNDLVPSTIPNPWIISLSTDKDYIPYSIYSSYLNKLYQLSLEKNPKNWTSVIILLPQKHISPSYKKVGIGGTFDRLHFGHYCLIQSGLFSATSEFSIGISGDSLLTKKEARDKIQPYNVREEGMKSFINKIKEFHEIPVCTFQEINVPEGTTTVDPEMDAVAVSKETENGIKYINGLREKKGYKKVESIVVDLVVLSNGSKVSSSDIRKEESK